MAVNKLIQQDQTVLWSLPPDAIQLQAQFRLSEELTMAARKKRSSVQQAIPKEDAMPAELRGYVLTQTLKTGVRLCTAYNVTECPHDPEFCGGRHLCSVVLQSGRACGGRHPAKECRGKRALTTKRFQEMQPAGLPSASTAPAEP